MKFGYLLGEFRKPCAPWQMHGNMVTRVNPPPTPTWGSRKKCLFRYYCAF